MTLEEANLECLRWLDYLSRQEKRATEFAQIAAGRRTGKYTAEEGRERILATQGRFPHAYDGAKLADAVRVILSRIAYDGAKMSENTRLLKQLNEARACIFRIIGNEEIMRAFETFYEIKSAVELMERSS